jgi:hypothetical protein
VNGGHEDVTGADGDGAAALALGGIGHIGVRFEDARQRAWGGRWRAFWFEAIGVRNYSPLPPVPGDSAGALPFPVPAAISAWVAASICSSGTTTPGAGLDAGGTADNDNSVPAGATRPPSLTTAGGPSGASGTGAPSGTTWQQNIRIRAQEASASTAAPLIARIDVLNPKAIYDTATSGLQQNTGTPVVACDFYFTAAGIAALAAAGVPVIVEVEVPYTVMR